MGSIDRTIEQLKEKIKEAKSRGDYSEVYRLESKLQDANRHKNMWFSKDVGSHKSSWF